MVNIEMSHQRKLSRHTLSRRSSICETASVGSTKSGKSNGSSEYNSSTSISQLSQHNPNIKKLNGFRKNGSQESDDSGGGIAANLNHNTLPPPSQAANILNVAEMLLHGVADHEILDIWLRSIQCEEFLSKFIDSGYDMPTISRITPQDLTAIGVTDPTKRLKILTEIKKLNLQDGLPTFRPSNLSHWLSLIRLDNFYYQSLCDQQIDTIEKLCQLTWEDFEDLGITKLGHQKRFQLAIERVKELEASHGKSSTKSISEPIYDTNPSQILLVASTENHSMNGPIINKQSSTGELSSTGSGSMQSVHSTTSVPQQQIQFPNQQQNISLASVPVSANTVTNPYAPQSLSEHHLSQQSTTISRQHQKFAGTNGFTNPQQPIYGQSQACIYQQPPLISTQTPSTGLQMMPPQAAQQSHYQLPHYQQHQPMAHHQQVLPPQPQLTSQNLAGQDISGVPNGLPVSNNLTLNGQHLTNQNINGLSGSNNDGLVNRIQNRQSMSQLPFSALANLPKHQQQLLQQSSIYATLSRQPSTKTKQPPPPVPIRTNSLKTNSIVETGKQVPGSNQSSMSHNSQNYGYQQMTNAQCNNVSTGRDDEFPPPPSPLSQTDSDDHDLLSLNSESNSTEVSHGPSLMTFRVG